LSDLANSCEYLTIDKECSAVSENQKARANRQVRCLNEHKKSCCYLCESRQDCAIKCRFLGNPQNEPRSQVEPEEMQPKNAPNTDEKTEVEQKEPERLPVACSLCYVEMSQTKTKIKIDGWEGPPPKLVSDDFGRFDKLSVLVYLCPKCGKIVFKADSQTE
jgi:hypothetical protein